MHCRSEKASTISCQSQLIAALDARGVCAGDRLQNHPYNHPYMAAQQFLSDAKANGAGSDDESTLVGGIR